MSIHSYILDCTYTTCADTQLAILANIKVYFKFTTFCTHTHTRKHKQLQNYIYYKYTSRETSAIGKVVSRHTHTHNLYYLAS